MISLTFGVGQVPLITTEIAKIIHEEAWLKWESQGKDETFEVEIFAEGGYTIYADVVTQTRDLPYYPATHDFHRETPTAHSSMIGGVDVMDEDGELMIAKFVNSKDAEQFSVN